MASPTDSSSLTSLPRERGVFPEAGEGPEDEEEEEEDDEEEEPEEPMVCMSF
jgi:hypothetical protein